MHIIMSLSGILINANANNLCILKYANMSIDCILINANMNIHCILIYALLV